ncbi:hypothetical protein QZH41_009953, partial [Actinostola sp. cb2023]
ASIESRVSICGQLVGMSNFLSTVLDFAPVLINLKTEKVVLCQSGQYTLALGGGISEPESLLMRQLDALVNIFVFYHGSLDTVRNLSKDQVSFLTNISIIWDCYVPFIRHYGDTLPAVFDPLPFLKAPKNSSGCFLKATHTLQACQRRHHVLGGCILHKKSVLCTQLETCITKRLLLLKPNQCHVNNCDSDQQDSARQEDDDPTFFIPPPEDKPMSGLSYHRDQATTSPQDCENSATEEYHDTVEDLATINALLQTYHHLKTSDLMVTKYSACNLDQPENSKVEKNLFKDLIDAEKVPCKVAVENTTKQGLENGRESGLSYSITRESPRCGCPGNCLGDTGLCLSQVEGGNPSNPSMPQQVPVDLPNEQCSTSTVDIESSNTTVADESMEQKQEADYVDNFDDNLDQIDGLVHINLYVQAHSNTVLILLADSSLSRDQETIKALWKTTLNELGELEVHLNQCPENSEHPTKPDDYSFLVYDAINNTTKGNLTEPVLQVDHMFCETAKTVHEQFTNCASLKAVTL